MSEAFSAIINVAAFVFPDGIVGIIEASAILILLNHLIFRDGVTTAFSSIPILQLPMAW